MRNLSSGVLPSRQMLHYELYPRALPPVTQSSAFQAPECLRESNPWQDYPKDREGLSLFIALRWMQEPSRGDDGAD